MFRLFLYSRRDLNPHGHNGHWILSPTCLPIPPLEPDIGIRIKKTLTSSVLLSEKRDLNPRPPPWQGDALPAELFSHNNERTLLISADANLKQFFKFERFLIEKIKHPFLKRHAHFYELAFFFLLNKRLISLSFISASTGVSVSISKWRISSFISSNKGSSKLKKLNCISF